MTAPRDETIKQARFCGKCDQRICATCGKGRDWSYCSDAFHIANQQPVAWRWRTKDRIHGFPTKWMLVDTNPKADSQFAEVAAMPDVEIELVYTRPVAVTPAMIERMEKVMKPYIVGHGKDELPSDDPMDQKEEARLKLADTFLRAALEPDA